MNKATVEDVISRFGSQQRVAELLGIWQTAVSGWVRRGAIPAKRQEQLLTIAQREGVKLTPEDFFAKRSPLTKGPSASVENGTQQPVREGSNVIPISTTASEKQTAGATTAPGGKDLYEIGDIPPLGHVPKNMYAWAIRRERHGEPSDRDAAGGGAHPDPGERRGPGHGDGRGRQLQRCVGLPRPADLALRRAQGGISHRRLGRVRHRLGGRLQGEALEGRRRGGHPLQPGRRRRRGVQWRRSHELAEPAHLGLRDPGRLLRPVLLGPVPPAHGAPEASDLGGERLLRAHPRHRLPHAVRPHAASAQARLQRPGLGRRRRARLHGDPDHRGLRRQRHRRDLRGGQARIRRKPRRQGRHQPEGLRLLGPAPGRRRRRRLQGLHEDDAASSARRSGRSPARATMSTSCSSTPAKRPSRSPPSSSSAAAWS